MWPFIGLFAWVLFISRARASWLGFGIGFGLWLYWNANRGTFLKIAIVSATLAVIGFIWFPNSMNKWTETNTIQYRLKYWQASIELWKESPIFGTGLASYRNKVYEAQGRLGERDPSFWKGYVEPKPRKAHNDYMESLNDGGLLYAFVFWGFILISMRNALKKGLDRARIAIFCGQVSVLVSAIFFFPMRLIDTQMLFFVQLGALCSESLPDSSLSDSSISRA